MQVASSARNRILQPATDGWLTWITRGSVDVCGLSSGSNGNAVAIGTSVYVNSVSAQPRHDVVPTARMAPGEHSTSSTWPPFPSLRVGLTRPSVGWHSWCCEDVDQDGCIDGRDFRERSGSQRWTTPLQELGFANSRKTHHPPAGRRVCSARRSCSILLTAALGSSVQPGENWSTGTSSAAASRKDSDPDTYKLWRQRAKPANFGLPTGMSAQTLVDYSKIYGVEITVEQAETFREGYLRAFPDIRRHWEEDTRRILSENLQCDRGEIEELQGWELGMLRRVCNGHTYKADGTDYDDDQIEACFGLLEDLNGNPYFDEAIAQRDFDKLHKLLFDKVATLSGRVRGLVSYTQTRNTPFQGAAADGAKRALWRFDPQC